MTLKCVDYVRGEVLEPSGWPAVIADQQDVAVRSEGFVVGVSGMVTYELDGTDVTIAFSSPPIGSNKLNVGCTGRLVWKEMKGRSQSWATTMKTRGLVLHVGMQCTQGPVNNADVDIFKSRS